MSAHTGKQATAPANVAFNQIGSVMMSSMPVPVTEMPDVVARFPGYRAATWLEVVTWACKNYEARPAILKSQVLTSDTSIMLSSGPYRFGIGILEKLSEESWETLTKQEQNAILEEFDRLLSYERVWVSPGKGHVCVAISEDGKLNVSAKSRGACGLLFLIPDNAQIAEIPQITTVVNWGRTNLIRNDACADH